MLNKFLGPRYKELVKYCFISPHIIILAAFSVVPWCLQLFPSKNSVRLPTAGTWGAVGAVGLVWATDWRLILDWVPYINGKFKKDN